MNSALREYSNKLLKSFDKIPEHRKEELNKIARIIEEHLAENSHLDIVVICTHNSRRSQLAEIWIEVGCEWMNISRIHSYSGGTEATAFNERMVYAVRNAGIDLITISEGDNPRYMRKEKGKNKVYFSKKYDHPVNPKKDYMALMVCDDADQNCPVVSGMRYRISLPFIDPKKDDDTPMEKLSYASKVEEIGREMVYLISKITIQ